MTNTNIPILAMLIFDDNTSTYPTNNSQSTFEMMNDEKFQWFFCADYFFGCTLVACVMEKMKKEKKKSFYRECRIMRVHSNFNNLFFFLVPIIHILFEDICI